MQCFKACIKCAWNRADSKCTLICWSL